MTTSGTTAWSMTVRDIIKTALNLSAILPAGSYPADDEQSDCILHLNGMLKSWSLQGVSLFREESADVTTIAATNSVTLPADVRNVSSARIVVSATQDRPLYPMGRSDYLSLPNKASVGSPTMYYLDRQRDAAVMHFWPVSATPVTIRLDYDRVPETVTSPSETLDIRQELYEPVWANLAVRVYGVFITTRDPPAELVNRARMLEVQMLDAERPDSYKFESWFDG